MCYIDDKNEMAGLHLGHLSLIQSQLIRDESRTITDGIFRALTKNLNPHLPAFTGLVAMVESVLRKDYGVLGKYKLVRLPLSIIGMDKVRYRTETVNWLHESILSMNMSDITTQSLRKELNRHGICIMFLCTCGVVMGRCEDVKAFYGSNDHKRMDKVRSAIDASMNPVEVINSFKDIPVPTMDLCKNGSENRMFERIKYLTEIASEAGHQDYSWIKDDLDYFINIAQENNSRKLMTITN